MLTVVAVEFGRTAEIVAERALRARSTPEPLFVGPCLICSGAGHLPRNVLYAAIVVGASGCHLQRVTRDDGRHWRSDHEGRQSRIKEEPVTTERQSQAVQVRSRNR